MICTVHSVDGRNTAPHGMQKNLQIMVDSPYGLVSRISEPSTVCMSHAIHVWHIYLHLVDLFMVNVGKYIYSDMLDLPPAQ